ncbi:MAG: carboxylate-amine ligase [Rhodobacteraceae bacterium]|nr:carboxylate-amine ligase [Paracoccaceae bacterium]
MVVNPSLRLGIEEEYLIVDAQSADLVRKPDPEFMKLCQKELGSRVTNEYLQCQLEIGTSPQHTVSAAATELLELRKTVTRVGSQFGYAIIASSTHPFSKWRSQTHTRKERYDALRADLGQTARRLLICGMHIHIEIEDPDLRVDLMSQATYFLPHLLALSCSSPFWEGDDTVLSSYRLTVFDSLPRTGLPDPLESYSAYEALLSHMIGAGCIEDATKLWWDVRPSAKFPTLEQRITDVCSRFEDAVAIVATFQSLVAFLYGLRSANQRWRNYPPTLVNENRWLAQRYGCTGSMIDLGKGQLVPFRDLVEELIELLSPHASALGCLDELKHIRHIAEHGNSSVRQRQAYKQAVDSGDGHTDALRKVVRHLVSEFLPAE